MKFSLFGFRHRKFNFDQGPQDINHMAIPLFLREVCDTDEDPALASAREAYNRFQESLAISKELKPVERVTPIRRRR